MSHSEVEPEIVWVLESEAFADRQEPLKRAIVDAGQRWVEWKDELRLPPGPVLFRGALGTVERVSRERDWIPGAFGRTDAFACSAWHPRAERRLLPASYVPTTVAAFTNDPTPILERLENPAEVFVRPDSPLKPFSGRVLAADRISLAALDFGFYYEDPALPILVGKVFPIESEYRFVVVDRQVKAGCAYDSPSRPPRHSHPVGEGTARIFAAGVARELEPPAPVYVMDFCLSGGSMYLLELNPFAGADLYRCSVSDVVRSVSASARRLFAASRSIPSAERGTSERTGL